MPRRLRRKQGKRVLFGTLDTSTAARGGTRHGGFGRESILADDAALARAPFYSDTASDAHRVPTESIYGRNGGKKVAELCLSRDFDAVKNLKIRLRELVSSRPSRYNLAQVSRIRSIVSIFLHAGAKISQRS